MRRVVLQQPAVATAPPGCCRRSSTRSSLPPLGGGIEAPPRFGAKVKFLWKLLILCRNGGTPIGTRENVGTRDEVVFDDNVGRRPLAKGRRSGYRCTHLLATVVGRRRRRDRSVLAGRARPGTGPRPRVGSRNRISSLWTPWVLPDHRLLLVRSVCARHDLPANHRCRPVPRHHGSAAPASRPDNIAHRRVRDDRHHRHPPHRSCLGSGHDVPGDGRSRGIRVGELAPVAARPQALDGVHHVHRARRGRRTSAAGEVQHRPHHRGHCLGRVSVARLESCRAPLRNGDRLRGVQRHLVGARRPTTGGPARLAQIQRRHVIGLQRGAGRYPFPVCRPHRRGDSCLDRDAVRDVRPWRPGDSQALCGAPRVGDRDHRQDRARTM